METHVEKINAILDAISQDIAEREKVADNAMHVLEKMKPSDVEYKEANLQFSANSFVAAYLRHIKDTASASTTTSSIPKAHLMTTVTYLSVKQQ